MRWINKLERKFGRYAIPNLMQYIVAAMAGVYAMEYVFKTNLITYYLAFIPSMIMQGQIWRLITFVIIPPDNSLLFVILSLYFFYMIGSTLEEYWGSFKFNLYYLLGIIGAVIMGLIFGWSTNTYLNLSMFLAFAYMFPDVQVMLFFFFPIKVKWLAYLDWLLFIFAFIDGDLNQKALVLAALLNFLIFFGKDFIDFLKNKKKYGSVQKNFRRQMREAEREKKNRKNDIY